jgi:phosphate transport system substrate-binding protein
MRIPVQLLPATIRLTTVAVVLSWNTTILAESVTVKGPASLTKALSGAGAAFRESGMDIRIEPTGGNTATIAEVGQKSADVAIMSRALTPQEKSKYPTRRFFEVVIAAQAFVPAVARNVWEGGVKTITKEQLQKIYEGKIKNWSELGGADGEIKYFNPDPTSAASDLLTTWLYEDPRRAPESLAEVVQGDGAAVRNMLEFTRNAISVLPPGLADGKEIFALGVADENGKVVQALEDNLLDRSYPLGRPVFLVFGDRPSGVVRNFLEFLRSPEGKVALVAAELTPVTPKELR